MNNLINENLKLVHFVIKKMNLANPNDYEDYYQVGIIGLINASNSFNSKFKTTFSTYAYICIKNEILKFLRKNNEYHISLDDTIYDEIKIIDTISSKEIAPIENIIIKETESEMKRIINDELDENERKIIKMVFGIECRKYKQKEIADILKIPQYKISRIKDKALKHIKRLLINKIWKINI